MRGSCRNTVEFQARLSPHLDGYHAFSGHLHQTIAGSVRMSSAEPNDLVTRELNASLHRLVGVAVFSGVINLLTLSGSLYMLQVYDRVIPGRNLATLLGLSLIVLFAYLLQGYFDALRARMLARVAAIFDANLQQHVHHAIATLPLRGAKPMLAQQPMRDLDQLRLFLSGMGPTALLDMPWMPLFLVALFVFHPLIGVIATLGCVAIVSMTVFTERRSKAAAQSATESNAQRQVLADAVRQNAEVVRALGMTGRFAPAGRKRTSARCRRMWASWTSMPIWALPRRCCVMS